MSPLACAAIAPHQTCPPEGNLGDSQIVFSVFGSILFSQPKGSTPDQAGIVPPTNTSFLSLLIAITFHLSSIWVVIFAVPS